MQHCSTRRFEDRDLLECLGAYTLTRGVHALGVGFIVGPGILEIRCREKTQLEEVEGVRVVQQELLVFVRDLHDPIVLGHAEAMCGPYYDE